ncbi:MAG: translation elongation factor 4 [Planctomycetota bacterium]|nr:translation elongation factor 4 [Planctomycetota bacterium]
MRLDQFRNFCIIAHIDHGKSTLADRLLLRTGVVTKREFRDQILDVMDLERERGITIKASAAQLPHAGLTLNLIDTPGHVDFSYEVSRSLHACEGALLLVDCAQGVEAQTVANAYMAVEAGLELVPVLNKIDLPGARPDLALEQLQAGLGFSPDEVLRVSAKTGEGVDGVLQAVVERIPPPEGDPDAPVRALLYDASYDDYRGVITYVRVLDGELKKGMRVRFLATGVVREVQEVGIFQPKPKAVATLGAGNVGYVVANIKTLKDVHIGDTLASATDDAAEPVPGFKEPQPLVFCGIYPASTQDIQELRRAIEKLHLNDASFTFHPESSEALGFGFRCGFLGPLHMEIVQERLERESGVEIIQTAPNVTYEVLRTDGQEVRIERPSELPESNYIEEFREPIVRTQMLMPPDAIGALMTLCNERRGKFVKQEYLGPTRVILTYDLPLAEIVVDFYDLLKSATRGYGTMDYELVGFQASDLVRLRILVSGTEVDALSVIHHREDAQRRGREVIMALRKTIPRQMFDIALQAAIGGKVLARETIKALRKNVTAKCYGGDVSRKRKLLEKQKEGKKRMRHVGNVAIPQEAFLAVLDRREERKKK